SVLQDQLRTLTSELDTLGALRADAARQERQSIQSSLETQARSHQQKIQSLIEVQAQLTAHIVAMVPGVEGA
ncbi:MAG: hypothetical protein GWP91_22205, partial [Rhodobacterales bacterium]|nr:hypothetical protein [Rhodobacterales bacterium]